MTKAGRKELKAAARHSQGTNEIIARFFRGAGGIAMKALQRVRNRIGGSLLGARREKNLTRELESHIQIQTEDNLPFGMPHEQAHREAVLKFGAIESN